MNHLGCVAGGPVLQEDDSLAGEGVEDPGQHRVIKEAPVLSCIELDTRGHKDGGGGGHTLPSEAMTP